MNKTKTVINRLMITMLSIYLILLLIISSIACYYAYKVKKEQMLATMDLALAHMEQEYNDILDNFWQTYMPIFERNSTIYSTFVNYFANSDTTELGPLEKKELAEALNQIKVRDSRIQWLGVYSYNRKINYYLRPDNLALEIISESFPYLEELNAHSATRSIYAGKAEFGPFQNTPYLVLCGNDPTGLGNGKLMIGYSLNDFVQTSDVYISGLSEIRFYITCGDQLLFDSVGTYDANAVRFPQKETEGNILHNGEMFYIRAVRTGTSDSYLSYMIPWRQIQSAAHRDTLMIFSISFAFALFSIIVLTFMNRSVSKEVSVIREGLDRIADNNLDYRLPTDFQQGGLPEIAQNINEMSSRLHENIQKAYYFELKQKDAQLAELQTTFNPHFLYNTLEMLRSKSFSNGDTETADLISQLSALFRGFINAKTFITLKEELAFSNRYFTLLSARYGDMVEVSYDIDSDLLSYGVIRNVFQLIIENYFVHGFTGESDNNYIHFTGKSIDEQTMLFSIEDNGCGMTDDALQELSNRIAQPIRHGDKSYGLKNLNQRLKLFYGPDYGMQISHGQENGLCVTLKMKKIRVEDYEKTTVTGK